MKDSCRKSDNIIMKQREVQIRLTLVLLFKSEN